MITPIVTANHADVHDAAALVATAFGPLDVSTWLVPDRIERERVLYAVFRIYVEHAIETGHVAITDDRTGVAVWFPRDGAPMDIPHYDRRLELACGQRVDQFRTLDAAFNAHHPGKAHHHLAFLAVHPNHQGRRIGTALLAAQHARLDLTGTPAYLEASSPRSYALYARHGYEPHGEPIELPDGPSLWPMWRDPQLGEPGQWGVLR